MQNVCIQNVGILHFDKFLYTFCIQHLATITRVYEVASKQAQT